MNKELSMKLRIKYILFIVFCLIPLNSLFAQNETVLHNGMRIFVKPMRAAPVVTVSFWVKNGSVYESEGEAGFSELVSRMIYSSSLNYSNHALENEINKLGLKLYKNSSNDCQSFTITGASKNFDRIMGLGIDGLFRAVFSDKDIKKSIQELKNEINELESQPDVVVHNAMMQEAFAIHPCRRPYYGLNPNFEGADTFILNRFYNKYYTPSNTIVIITGDVKADEAIGIVKKYTDKIKETNFNEPELPKEITQNSYREIIKYADLQKVYLCMGWKIPQVEGSDKYALYVLAKLLGGDEDSILWQRLVKGRQTGEFICSEYETSRFQGVLVVSGISSKSKIRYFVDDIRRITNSLIEDTVSESFLEEIKKSIINEDIFKREGVESSALDYGSFAVVSKASDADLFENGIMSVNYEDIRRVACEYLRDENLSVAILQAPPVSEDATPVMLTLDNGIKLILKENHASPVISVSAKFFAGGLREEKRNAGISCLAGELLYRSLDSDDKSFRSKLEKNGARLSYKACKDYVSVDMKSVSSSFIPAFDIFIKMLDKPEFPSAYSKARSVLEKQLEQENKDIILQNEYNTLKAIFGSSPLTYSNFGRLDDLSKIKRSDVVDYYKKYFVPSNMVIAVVGDFYASELRDYLLASLGKISSKDKSSKELKNNDTESFKFGTPVLMKNNTEDAHILFFSRTAPANERKIVALNVACRILENSLKNSFKEADQTGLMASSVKIRNKSFYNDGYFEASVMTKNDNIATAAQLLNLEVEAFKISNIAAFKIQEAKDALFTEFALSMTDSMSLADIFSRDEILGLGFDYYTKYSSILSSINMIDVIEASKEYMLPEKKYAIGVSASNSADLIMEDKKLVFKAPKKEEAPKDSKTDKESGKDSTTKDSSNKDNTSKDNKPAASSSKK